MQELGKSQSSMATLHMAGLVGVSIILPFQFHSYSLPLIVMASIPFALIGTILGHLLMGLDLSIPSMIGFASLAGVVANNASLLLTFFEASIKDGDYTTAAVDAVQQRFRPVLPSSTTIFVGLLPIIFETSPQVLVPLVVSVAFGLLASTVLVVFVFPSSLSIFFNFKDVNRWLKTREDKKNEPQ